MNAIHLGRTNSRKSTMKGLDGGTTGCIYELYYMEDRTSFIKM